jgi:Pectin methylesterase
MGICYCSFNHNLNVGCKKDFSPSGNDETLNQETRTASSKSKAPDIIVHAGGSIQVAVDAANPGDIIQIEAGTYQEAVVVNKPGIQLIGLTGSANERVIIENPRR